MRDEGYDGVIVRLGERFAQIRAEDCEITAQAGALLPRIASVALEHRLTGFEFACGIPGSAGGALYMNAGAYGGEMKDIVSRATLLQDAEKKVVKKAALGLSYRHSALMDGGAIVLDVTYCLAPGEYDTIKGRMDELKAMRSAKQPVQLPSAGSAFKRPANGYAAAMILSLIHI